MTSAPGEPASSELDLEGESLDGPAKLTREDKKIVADAYRALAERLSKPSNLNLPDPPFDAHVRAAIEDARRFAKNAKTRQVRRLAQILSRTETVEVLEAAIAGRSPEVLAAQAREQIYENWRARLLDEQDAGLALFVEQHPDADRTRLRQLLRQASKTPPDAKSKKASTALLREIRRLGDAVRDDLAT